MYTKEYLEKKICVAMGGRIAEELVLDSGKVTSGASNDFMLATNTARTMVEKMGMSELIGPRALFNTIPTPM